MKPEGLFKLKSDEVHIWSACLPDHENDLAYFISILSQDECDRAKSFKFSKDQKRFVITRGILRCLLSRYIGYPIQSIEIIYGLWGKPTVLPENSIYFNLSHSGEFALYAITKNYEVGIDIEHIDRNFDIESIASNVFSRSELNDWRRLSLEDKVYTFFKGWVCKEAVLKAYGKGWLENNIPQIIKSVIFQREFLKNSSSINSGYPYCFELIPGYASALFIIGPFLRPEYHTWDKIL